MAPDTAASDDENTELDLDYTGWNRPTATAADHLWAADMLRAIRLCTKSWKPIARRHGAVKTIRDATRMAERLYLEARGWR